MFRPSQKINFVPGIGIHVITPQAAAASWWLSGGISAANCIAAYQAKGAASYAASLVNLAQQGTYDVTEGIGPLTWATGTGWVGDGVNYLRTGITPTNNYSIIAKFANFSLASTQIVMGERQAGFSTRMYLMPVDIFSTGWHTYQIGANLLRVANKQTSGIMAITNLCGYLNGVLDAGPGTWADGTTQSIWIMGGNNGGVLESSVIAPGECHAVAIYNIDISSYIVDLIAAMAAL